MIYCPTCGRAYQVGDLRPAELAVTRLVAQGLADKEISARLNLSLRTVQNQVAAAKKRLGVRSRVELALVMSRAESE